jgi:hypothetical protein
VLPLVLCGCCCGGGGCCGCCHLQELLRHHPYDVPQITAVPIVASSAQYERWMEEVLLPPK